MLGTWRRLTHRNDSFNPGINNKTSSLSQRVGVKALCTDNWTTNNTLFVHIYLCYTNCWTFSPPPLPPSPYSPSPLLPLLSVPPLKLTPGSKDWSKQLSRHQRLRKTAEKLFQQSCNVVWISISQIHIFSSVKLLFYLLARGEKRRRGRGKERRERKGRRREREGERGEREGGAERGERLVLFPPQAFIKSGEEYKPAKRQ